MSQKYDFSVIIPTHNRSAFLKEALESIIMQKAEVEVIVINDCSTDDTEKVIQSFEGKFANLIYLKNDQCLFAHNSRKKGYLQASGKYIIFMDDDDVYIDENFFVTAKKIFLEHPSVNAVMGTTCNFSESGIFSESGVFSCDDKDFAGGVITNREYYNNLLVKYWKPCSTLTLVLRKTALEEVELHKSKMVNDTCIYLLGTLYGDVYLHNQAVAGYRLHANNISNKKFPLSFIFGTLNEKIRIYKMAKKMKKLDDPYGWLKMHLTMSIGYFLKASGHAFKYKFLIFNWLLFCGRGVQFVLVKEKLKEIFSRKQSKK